MAIVLREPWTVERFLSWEDGQEGRHEFDGTRIVEMTGGSRAHQRIVHYLVRPPEDRLDPARFDAVAEMRIVVEVLSADTAGTDRGEKRLDYARLPGLCRYILVEQDRAAVTILERTSDGWAESEIAGAAGAIALPEIGVELTLAEVYRGVSLTCPPRPGAVVG